MTLPTVELGDETLTLHVATSVGPRILGLQPRGASNLFATLPRETLTGATRGRFHFHGGHRLWAAPEHPTRTYAPDDLPPDVLSGDGWIEVTGPTEPESGLQKQLHITLEGQGGVRITHRLINRGPWPIECAPWAITQLRPGGTAILPLGNHAVDPHEVRPNRAIVFWPYTRLDDPALELDDCAILARAPAAGRRLKIGIANPHGWLAYHLDGWLFIKNAPYDPRARYADLGASSQVYADERFVELETLGPLNHVDPGESLAHTESWQVTPLDRLPAGPDAIYARIAALRPE